MNIKGSTFLTIVFVTSLIINCVGIGVVVGRRWHKQPDAIRSQQQRSPLRQRLIKAIPADKRDVFRELRRDQRPVLREKREAIRHKRLALLEVLTSDLLPPEELDRAIEATVTAQADLFRERTWPLAQLTKTLTVEERRRLAETLYEEYHQR